MSAFDPKRTFSIQFCCDAQQCSDPPSADVCCKVEYRWGVSNRVEGNKVQPLTRECATVIPAGYSPRYRVLGLDDQFGLTQRRSSICSPSRSVTVSLPRI